MYLFLSQLQGVTSSIYPPESLGDFVQKLFLHGDTDHAALRHKLALFLYCLLDRQGGAAGQKLNLASFRLAICCPPGTQSCLDLCYHQAATLTCDQGAAPLTAD